MSKDHTIPQTLIGSHIVEKAEKLFKELSSVNKQDLIRVVNKLRLMIHKHSPFREEPVDCVLWVPFDSVQANDYNPNNVAHPEMRLLERSVQEDGYTQPIVTWGTEGHYEVVDGFHRNRVGKESKTISKRVKGHLPVSVINENRQKRGDRIASTIRHNRARGKHTVDGMTDIVQELKKRDWSDEKIGRELGMDADEVLRLAQITGLAEMFADREFSEAWKVNSFDDRDFKDEVEQ